MELSILSDRHLEWRIREMWEAVTAIPLEDPGRFQSLLNALMAERKLIRQFAELQAEKITENEILQEKVHGDSEKLRMTLIKRPGTLIKILPSDRFFDDCPETGDPACICSRCGAVIEKGPVIRAAPTEEGEPGWTTGRPVEFRYHIHHIYLND